MRQQRFDRLAPARGDILEHVGAFRDELGDVRCMVESFDVRSERRATGLVTASLVGELNKFFRNVHNALLRSATLRIEAERELKSLERVLSRRRNQPLRGQVVAA